MMTCASRIKAIRLMEKMEKSNQTTKLDDGTMKYHDRNGNVMVEAKMKKKEA